MARKVYRGVIVGIDLGTTNSVVTVLENDGAVRRVLDIGWSQSARTANLNSQLFRSAVNVPTGIVGPDADSDDLRPTSYFNLKKKFIEDAHQIINEPGKGRITPYKYQLMILNEMYDRSMQLLNDGEFEAIVKSVCVTVPTEFKDAHRREMIKLIEESRWGSAEKISLIDEPISATMVKLIEDPTDATGNWITYDLGGGTFDSTLLESFDFDGQYAHKAHISRGDLNIGGYNFDEAIWDIVRSKIIERDVRDMLDSDSKFREEMKVAFMDNCGDIKMMLDSKDKYDDVFKITLPSYGRQIISVEISRNEYWNKILPLVDETVRLSKELLAFAKENGIKIEGINFVGGSTKDPEIRKYVKEQLGLKKAWFNKPMIIVSQGGALNAGIQYAKENNDAEGVAKIQTAIQQTVTSPIGFTLADGTIKWVASEGDPLPSVSEEEVSGIERGQTSVAFSYVQASKMYYGIEGLQGNYFISDEVQMTGFKYESQIPRFIVRTRIDENMLVEIEVEQVNARVTKHVKSGQLFNQKDQVSKVGTRKEKLSLESFKWCEGEVKHLLRSNHPADYLEAAIMEIEQIQKTKPELKSVQEFKSIVENAKRSINENNEREMIIWLHRIEKIINGN